MSSPSMESELVFAGRYRLKSIMGCGGMSQVYRAVDERLRRTVAVKLVKPEASGGQSPTPFEAEVCAMSGMDHPGVVRLLDAGIDRGQAYLVMDLVDGGNLADLLCGGPLPEETISRLAVELAGSLAYLHDQGVTHRDVKPGNILVSRDGTARLADFGIAQVVDGISVTATDGIVGTAPYLAPEQVRGEPVGPPADVYALGLILLECRTGRREYTGEPTEAALARLTRSPRIPSSCPVRWRDLLAAMTAQNPDDRPDAHEVVNRLGAGMAAPIDRTERLEPVDQREGPHRSRSRLQALAAAFVLLAGVGAGALAGGRPDVASTHTTGSRQVAGAARPTAAPPPGITPRPATGPQVVPEPHVTPTRPAVAARHDRGRPPAAKHRSHTDHGRAGHHHQQTSDGHRH
jgi:serine/threonine protein kinase